jgi:hypothetical protein
MLSTKALMFIPLFFAGLGIATGTQRRPLERVLRVGKLLAGADPGSAKYLRAGHHYVDVLQWRNSQEVLVRVSGHFDRHPVCEFELRHRVRLNGLVA